MSYKLFAMKKKIFFSGSPNIAGVIHKICVFCQTLLNKTRCTEAQLDAVISLQFKAKITQVE